MTKKRRLLVVAGSGSAVDFGMPNAQGIGEFLRLKVQEDFVLAEKPTESLYGYLHDEIARHWKTTSPSTLPPKEPNFEDVLYVLSTLAGIYPAGVLTRALGAFLAPPEWPEVIQFGRRRTIDQNVVNNLSQKLCDYILTLFRDLCRRINPELASDLQLFHNFFTRLQESSDIAVVTTDYDDLIHRTLPELETGFDRSGDGQFQSGRIFGRKDWPCLLHMHGSVHFDMRTVGNDLHAICWQSDLELCHQNSFGRGARHSIEGDIYPTSSIVVGYGKTVQILTVPFRIYYSELDRLIFESDAVLFLGYGFGDMHLNAGFSNYGTTRDRQVVVVDHASDDVLAAGSAFYEGSPTAKRAMSVFDVPFHRLSSGKVVPDSMKTLRQAREFDRCDDAGHRLSLWYNGMLESCKHADKVAAELTRGPAP